MANDDLVMRFRNSIQAYVIEEIKVHRDGNDNLSAGDNRLLGRDNALKDLEYVIRDLLNSQGSQGGSHAHDR